MNIIQLYDQFTTTWEKIRANIVSHAIAAGLLWLVGFAPPLPLPPISDADLTRLMARPLYQMLQGVGIVAIASFALAFVVAVYALVLRQLGRVLSLGLMILFPPALSWSPPRKAMPEGALFNIAATLDGGTYQPSDLESRMGTLFANYSMTRPQEVKTLWAGQQEFQRDATTHFNNGAVFVAAWICALWLLPEHSALALAVRQVFWSGLAALLIYLVIARARVLFALQLAVASVAQVTALLVEKDSSYKDRLAAARSNPAPYRELVRRYRAQADDDDATPSLLAYIGTLLDRRMARFKRKSTIEKQEPGPVRAAFEDLRRFGWDKEANRDYKDPMWFPRYVGWRAVRAFDNIRTFLKSVLVMLGLRRP